MNNILSLMLILPILGILIVTLLRKNSEKLMKVVVFLVNLVNFLLSLLLSLRFNYSNYEIQFIEKYDWVKDFGIRYFIGIDNLSLVLVLLTTFIFTISMISTWSDIKSNVKGYLVCILLLETGIIGTLVALDFFLFYVFWEIMLVPMCMLIGIWGTPEKRIYSATKYFIYMMLGSISMMIAIIYLYLKYYYAYGVFSFNIFDLYNLSLNRVEQIWLFCAFAFSFAIKAPLVPLHSWLPDAHSEAPTFGSVILAAILLKLGGYGFIRFCIPLLPNAAIDYGAWLFMILGATGVIYGGLLCLVQEDIKRLVAYSSVSHMGYVMVGIFGMNEISINGAIIQMLNHGLTTGLLFLMVGILYERTKTRFITDLGGLANKMPMFAILFLITILSSIGLPGLNGFIGEFLIIQGVFFKNLCIAFICSAGLVISAAYMLRMYKKLMYDDGSKRDVKVTDLGKREVIVIMVFLLFMVFIGLYPKPLLHVTSVYVNYINKYTINKYRMVELMESSTYPKKSHLNEVK